MSSSLRTSRKRKSKTEEDEATAANLHVLNRSLTEMQISSSKSLEEWDLPPTILHAYSLQGIKEMFQWQVDCLKLPGVLQGHNLIYSAPTSAGKTLVAEILAIKTVIEGLKKAIFILPYKAVVNEKTKYFKKLLSGQGLRVGAFMGKQGPPGGLASVDVAVCVIEKANSMINRMILERSLSQVGIVIVDELHQLADSSRGYLLELLITKLRYMCHKDNTDKIQLVGMSATLPNLQAVANWLNALLYTTDFRPVPLQQHAIHKGSVYSTDFTLMGKIQPEIAIENDEKCIAWLCLKTVLTGHSALIFCSTKAQVEAVALKIAKTFFTIGNQNDSNEESIQFRLRSQLKHGPIEELIEQLKQCPVGLLNVIKRVVSFGVGIHHAGLSEEEREIIESGFRTSALRVMVATSTLCSGVNLPARTIMICYSKYLTPIMYQQMAGRAGRMGIDTAGESYLVMEPRDKVEDAVSIMSPTLLNPLKSSLWTEDGLSSPLLQSVLELIACEVGHTEEDVKTFLWCSLHITLMKEEGKDMAEIEPKIVECVEYLTSNEFIRRQDGEKQLLIATRLGKACLAAALRPDDAMELYVELERAQKKFVLSNELHLIYLAVPQLGVVAINDVDWYRWMTQFAQLPPLHRYVADAVGVEESFIHKAYRDLERPRNMTQQKLLVVARHVRFRKALALLDLVNEVSLDTVANALGVSRGVMQSLQQAASMQAGRVTAFCRELGWHSMEVLMSSFQDRLQFGVQHELCELMKISLLNSQRARILFDSGLTTVTALAHASVDEIEKALANMAPFQRQEQEGESAYDANMRRQMKTLFVTGQQGVTEHQAAEAIVEEARTLIQEELGLSDINWGAAKRPKPDDNSKLVSQSSRRSIGSPNVSLIQCSQNNQNEDPNRGLASLEIDVAKFLKKDTPNRTPLQSSKRTRVSTRSQQKSQQPLRKSSPKQALDQEIHLSPPVPRSSSPDPFAESSPVSQRLTYGKPTTPRSSHTEDSDSSVVIEASPKLPNASCQFDDDLAKVMEIFEQDFAAGDYAGALNLKSKKTEEGMKSSHNTDNLKDSLDDVAFLSLLEKSPSVIQQQLSNADIVLHNNSPKLRPKTPAVERKCSPRLQSKVEQQQSPKLAIDPQSSAGTSMETFEIVLVSKKEVHSAFQKELLSKKKLSISLAVEDVVRERIGERIVTGAAKSEEQAHSKKIVGVSFCWGGLVCYYMDLTETSGEHASCVSKMRLLQKLLSNQNISLFFHNAKSQLLLLRQQTTICMDNLPLCGDPFVAAWLLNPDGTEDSLHSLAGRNCPQVMSQCSEFSGLLSHSVKTRSHRTAVSNHVEPYVCASTEACLTYHLCEKLHSQLENEGLMGAYLEVELPLVRVLVESESAGFRFNVKEGQKMLQSVENVKTSLEQTAHDLVHWKFNLNSPKHVAIALFDKLGLKPLDQVGRVSKSRSTNKDVLAKLASSGSTLPTIILEHRKVEYIITQNLAPLLQHVEKVGNAVTRIHPCYTTHTSTGRIYMREPNLQNIPKEFTIEEHRMCPRMAFEAAAGHTLISADYSQVELRLLAHFSQDPTLMKVLCSSKDIFREIAAKLQDVPYSKITDVQRQHAKKVCYGILYGMSAEKLVTEISCQSLAEARTFVHEFTNKFPLADKYLNEVAEKCRKEGAVQTLKGRKRYFQVSKASSAHAERQAKNTVLQGSAADLTKVAMLQVHKLLEARGLASCTKLVLHLHDELIYEAPSCSVQEVAKVVKHGMETAVKLKVPLPVKMKSGASWGQLHEFVD